MNRTAIAVLTAAVSLGAYGHDSHLGPSSEAAPPPQGNELSTGEVRDLEREFGVITIRHGVLDRLGMPPMTMDFQVADPAVLEYVAPGDRIGFRAVKAGDAFIAEEIEPAK